MKAPNRPLSQFTCTNFKCDGARLVYRLQGDSYQSENGFFRVSVTGLYCPRCGAGFGGGEPPKPRRFVRMFKPQFALLVEAGKKRQTVRPRPARMPGAGDVIDCRTWTGKPYRSKQRKLVEAPLTKVEPIEIREAHEVYIVTVGTHVLFTEEFHAFAKADGFIDYFAMVEWFKETHGLPFRGIVLYW